MKNWKKALIIFLCTLLGVTCLFLGLFLWRVSQAVGQIAEDFNTSLQKKEDASIEEEDGIFMIYQTLYENLEKYGGLDESMEASTRLADTLMERTIKQWTIQDIEWQDDGFLVTVDARGIDLEKLDGRFVTNVLVQATMDLMTHHFTDALGSVFQGQEEMMKVLYGSFGPLLFEAAADLVDDMPSQEQSMQLSIHNENGKWNIEVLSDDPAE